MFFDFFFYSDSSAIEQGVFLVAVVVGLDQKPGGFVQGIVPMDAMEISFDDGPLVGLDPTNNVVDRRIDSLIFEFL